MTTKLNRSNNKPAGTRQREVKVVRDRWGTSQLRGNALLCSTSLLVQVTDWTPHSALYYTGLH